MSDPMPETRETVRVRTVLIDYWVARLAEDHAASNQAGEPILIDGFLTGRDALVMALGRLAVTMHRAEMAWARMETLAVGGVPYSAAEREVVCETAKDAKAAFAAALSAFDAAQEGDKDGK